MTDDDDRLSGSARLGLIVLGAALIAGAWPVGFIAAVIAGGGHTSPFEHGPAEAVFGSAMLGIPVVMILLGIACLMATSLRRLRIAGLLGLLLPIDFAVIAASIWYLDQPSPPVYVPPPDQDAVLNTTVIMAAGPPPPVLCSSARGKCEPPRKRPPPPTAPVGP